MLKIGSRIQVMHGNAYKTSGGLTKAQLKYNKQGKIVSKKASNLAKKNNRLVKAGMYDIFNVIPAPSGMFKKTTFIPNNNPMISFNIYRTRLIETFHNELYYKSIKKPYPRLSEIKRIFTEVIPSEPYNIGSQIEDNTDAKDKKTKLILWLLLYNIPTDQYKKHKMYFNKSLNIIADNVDKIDCVFTTLHEPPVASAII